MMFTFHHRKLLNDSVEDSSLNLCQNYCNPSINQDGFCPVPCLASCYPICNNPIINSVDAPPTPPFMSYDDDNLHVRSHQHSIFFTLSLALLAATFLLCTIYSVYKFCQRRRFLRRNQPPSQAHPLEVVPIVREFSFDQNIGSVVDHPIWYIRTVGLQPSIISSIGTCKYKKGDGLVEGTDCSVCLNEFQDDEILRLLPKCEHAFHITCIDTWLRSHTNCPLCRASIVITTSNSQSIDQRSRGLSNVIESQIEENREVEIDVDNDNDSLVEIDHRHSREDDGGSGTQQWGEENGVHLLRRSFSVDSLAASGITVAIANANAITSGSSTPKKDESCQKDLNSTCSSSNEPKGPSIMVKRSLSCSAKVFLSRYSRSKSSIPPPL